MRGLATCALRRRPQLMPQTSHGVSPFAREVGLGAFARGGSRGCIERRVVRAVLVLLPHLAPAGGLSGAAASHSLGGRSLPEQVCPMRYLVAFFQGASHGRTAPAVVAGKGLSTPN